jgi:hypothetical protein
MRFEAIVDGIAYERPWHKEKKKFFCPKNT